MKCEICGASPAMHRCVVTGKKSESRFLCETHAREAGLPLPDLKELFLQKYRKVIAFIKATGRTPTPAELSEQVPDSPPVQPESKQVAEMLSAIESLVQFVETRGRMPTDEEVAQLQEKL